MISLLSDADFLYSFFLGLTPSLMDITTDFAFADRFCSMYIGSNMPFLIVKIILTNRLAKEGELAASGVVYVLIIMPFFDLVISGLGTILENNQESQLLVHVGTAAGEHKVKHIKLKMPKCRFHISTRLFIARVLHNMVNGILRRQRCTAPAVLPSCLCCLGNSCRENSSNVRPVKRDPKMVG